MNKFGYSDDEMDYRISNHPLYKLGSGIYTMAKVLIFGALFCGFFINPRCNTCMYDTCNSVPLVGSKICP